MTELGDKELRSRLEAYGEANRDHWSYRGNATRRHAHAYFQYPAMMVPQMVGDLLGGGHKRQRYARLRSFRGVWDRADRVDDAWPKLLGPGHKPTRGTPVPGENNPVL